jgi:hypothetical protein
MALAASLISRNSESVRRSVGRWSEGTEAQHQMSFGEIKHPPPLPYVDAVGTKGRLHRHGTGAAHALLVCFLHTRRHGTEGTRESLHYHGG